MSRKTNHTNGTYTSNGHNSGYAHVSRTENKSNTGFFLFIFGLLASLGGLIAYFM